MFYYLCFQTVSVRVASHASVADSVSGSLSSEVQSKQVGGMARKKVSFPATPLQQTTGK
jgi:hypothetical protein